jgi:hypothetical protein
MIDWGFVCVRDGNVSVCLISGERFRNEEHLAKRRVGHGSELTSHGEDSYLKIHHVVDDDLHRFTLSDVVRQVQTRSSYLKILRISGVIPAPRALYDRAIASSQFVSKVDNSCDCCLILWVSNSELNITRRNNIK